MQSRRRAKIARAVQEQVSTTILFELRDPRIQNVTVTKVEVAPDVRSAKVYVSVMGDEKEQALCLHGLNSARGFLQSKVADRIQTRYTPILTFVNDPGVKKSIEAARLLREVFPPEADDMAAAEPGAEPDGELDAELDGETEAEPTDEDQSTP
jgi:ribosome-binding factor A